MPGSHLIISHGTPPDEMMAAVARAKFAEDTKSIQSLYERQTTTPFRMRSPAEIESFFDGYDLLEPGLAWVSEWRPVDGDPDDFAGAPSMSSIMAAVGKRR